MEKLLSNIKRVFGFPPKCIMTDLEADLLEKLGAEARVAIVEIGSWVGRSTIRLAKQSKVSIYAIDPHHGSNSHNLYGIHDTYPLFIKNIGNENMKNKIIPLVLIRREAECLK